MNKTEGLLRTLFDFQRFAGNKRLEALIRDADGAGNGVPLEDSALEVNAAGGAEVWRSETKDGLKP